MKVWRGLSTLSSVWFHFNYYLLYLIRICKQMSRDCSRITNQWWNWVEKWGWSDRFFVGGWRSVTEPDVNWFGLVREKTNILHIYRLEGSNIQADSYIIMVYWDTENIDIKMGSIQPGVRGEILYNYSSLFMLRCFLYFDSFLTSDLKKTDMFHVYFNASSLITR